MKANLTTKEMTSIALGAVLMAVFSQLSIPLPAVPLTLQVFGAIFLALLLGSKLATFSMVIYILLGAIGIPVFANFGRGLGVLVGPTGGYIIGFLVLAWLVGKASGQTNKSVLIAFTYLGLILQYTIGTIQLKFVLGVDIAKALAIGVYPFIIKDLILTGVAIMIGMQMKKYLRGFANERMRA